MALIRALYILFVFFFVGVGIVGISYYKNSTTIEEWLQKPEAPGVLFEAGGRKLYGTRRGSGPALVVFFTGFGVSSAEWWSLQNILAKEAATFTFDRPGYGWSEPAPATYSSSDLARDLAPLLDQIREGKPLILVGHGVGALQAVDLARTIPQSVASVVVIDPPPEPKFIKDIEPQWNDRFVDQRPLLSRTLKAAKLGFFRFLNLTPYDVPVEIRPHVLNNLAKTTTVEAMMAEFQNVILREDFWGSENLGSKKTSVLYHASEDNRQLMREYGAPEEVVASLETQWAASTKRLLELSSNSEWIEADKGLFSIHIDNPEAIVQVVRRHIQSAAK